MENTMTLTQGHGERVEDTVHGKFLTFWTDEQLYGVSIADVVQIVGIQNITPVPEYPYYAKGIINLRGGIIPIIDVRLRFGKAEAEHDERTCIIVTNLRDRSIGFIVDAVDEVTNISDDQIALPPVIGGGTGERFLTGIGKLKDRVVLLLDTKTLLSIEDVDAIFSEGQ